MKKIVNWFRDQDWKKNLKIFLGALMVVFSLAYLMEALSGPKKKLNRVHDLYADTTGTFPVFTEDSLNILLLPARDELAFTGARLALSGKDSIMVSFNLTDSLAQLEIQAVVLQSFPLRKISCSSFFRKLKPSARYNMLGKALPVSRVKSTIKKYPVIIKKAPRDTLEAARQNTLPDTSDQRPVIIRLELEPGINLFLEQSDHRNLPFYARKLFFSLNHRSRVFIQNCHGIFSRRINAYKPSIHICMLRKDLVTLYRALPEEVFVALRLPVHSSRPDGIRQQ